MMVLYERDMDKRESEALLSLHQADIIACNENTESADRMEEKTKTCRLRGEPNPKSVWSLSGAESRFGVCWTWGEAVDCRGDETVRMNPEAITIAGCSPLCLLLSHTFGP